MEDGGRQTALLGAASVWALAWTTTGLNHGVDLLPARCYHFHVRTLTIKLDPGQNAWLERQAKALKRSKGGIIRDLIHEQQSGRKGSLGQALADLRGCLTGSKGLSTRSLKGYGRG